MFQDFQLSVICKIKQEYQLLYVPLQAGLQRNLSQAWYQQWAEFTVNTDTIEFDAGYTPETHERFVLEGYQLPNSLANENRQSLQNLDLVDLSDIDPAWVKGIAAYVLTDDDAELILFQNSSRSHIIKPVQFLFFDRNLYKSSDRPALTLDSRLSAIYIREDANLLFNSFRTVNTFLPIADYYQEASEETIREILQHERLLAENADALVAGSNQWFRKRFAMLRDSGVLDQFSPRRIARHANGFGLEINIRQNRIVFPADKAEAKRLLQFLNEELYKGPITDTLYETNSKREADG